MDAQISAQPQEKDSPSDGRTANAPLVSQKIQEPGVGREHPDANEDALSAYLDSHYAAQRGSWYVLRATYGRALKAKEIIDELNANCECLVPTFVQYKRIDGHIRKKRRPFLAGLLFVFGHDEAVRELVKDNPNLPYVSYYYDHFSPVPATPLVVTPAEMKNFLRFVMAESDEKLPVRPSLVHYRSDDLVEITGGPFKGVRGRVARVLGQQRVVVKIIDSLVVTSYIPTPLLRKINENEL